MNKLPKVVLLCVAVTSFCFLLGGCGSSNAADTGAGSAFEQKINAPKGPPPPEAAKATADALAQQNAAPPSPTGAR